MAAVALLVTNVGLVQLAGVQPAQAAVVSSLVFSENFDGVVPPALPAGWTAIRADGRASDQKWQTSTPGFTTAPNKASVGSYGHVTDMILESPAFVAGAATRLRFYKQGIMQATTGQFSGDNLDGVVLEIKIGTAGYVDFLAAGGSFNEGEGYNRRIASNQENPLRGRMGWSGHQLGHSVTNATFPNSATGQTVRLRWRLGTSQHTANQGGPNFFQDQAFAIDSVEVFSDKTTQTISFTSVPPFRPQAFTTYTPTATASSGLPVTFSIAPGSTCSIAAGVVTFETPGICDIQADQAGNASFAPAPRATQGTFAVKADQIMSFTSTAPENPQVGTTYTPTATTSSGGPITISIAAGSSSVCSIGAANLVTFTAPGSCVIQADQAGNGNLNPARVTQTVNVVAAPLPPQTISFTSTAPSSPQAFTTYTPQATATSGLAVSFSVASGSVCSLAGGVVTFETPGPCTIQADQAGNASFAPAPRVTQSMTVVKADQTVSFTSTAPQNPQVGTTYTPTAEASSGGPVTYSVAAVSSSVCSIGAANLVTFNAAGSCVIQADQVGNANLNPAPQVTQTVNVAAAGPASQTISFTSTGPVNPPVGDTYTPTATASSGLGVIFSIAPVSSSVCSLGAANLVTFNAAGSCVIQADQAGDAGFAAAPTVTQSVTVVAAGPVSQTISFTSTAPVNPLVGATYTATATATSGLPVAFSIAPVSSPVCSLGAANLVTFNAAGSCLIQADQAGNGSFTAALQVTQTVTVVKANQAITFTSTAPVNPQVGDTYSPAATATSGLPVSFSIAAASGSVCSIGAANLVTFNAAGSCIMQADQAGNAGFAAAPPVTQTVTMVKATSSLSIQAIASATFGQPISATAGVTGSPTGPAPTGGVTFTAYGPDDATCSGAPAFTSQPQSLAGGPPPTASAGSFTPAMAGTYRWIAAYSGDANYLGATTGCNVPNGTSSVRFSGPHMTLTATAPALLGAPASVTYTTTLVNDGSDALYHVGVSDPDCVPVTLASGDVNGDQLLNPAETWTYTCTRTISIPGTFTNTARASGFNTQTGLAVSSNAATATVTVTGPHMTLSTSANPNSGAAPLNVTYTYNLVNDGTDTLFHAGVIDDGCSPLNLIAGDVNNNQLLNPGETWTFNCTRSLTATTTNSATARATNTQTGLAVSSNTATATATVTVTGPHMILSKAANPPSGSAPLTATYTYALVNDGTDTLFHVGVTDSACAPVTLQSGDVNGDQLLNAGETWTFRCTATLTTPGSHTTTATASGTNTQTGLPVSSNPAQATLTVT